MTLQLDARRRAMLEEMGVRVFEPLHGPATATAALAAPPAPPPRARPLGPPAAQSSPGAFAGQPASVATEVENMDWEALARSVADGQACPLCRGPTVFGAGDTQPDWLIVGDPPDENEEAQGEPFAGEPGLLLDNMLRALGLDRRGTVYLTNVMKCRPPGNRNPTREDIAACEPVLRRQVQLLQPRIILVMGRFAVPSLLGTTDPIGKLRGRAFEYQGVPVVATYHPAYLLRNLADKGKAWADLCLARELLRAQPAPARSA